MAIAPPCLTISVTCPQRGRNLLQNVTNDGAPSCGGVLPNKNGGAAFPQKKKKKKKKEEEGEEPWQTVAVLPLEEERAVASGDGLWW